MHDHSAEFEQQLKDFETAWESGVPPEIDVHLTAVPFEERWDLLVELVKIDLDRRSCNLLTSIKTYFQFDETVEVRHRPRHRENDQARIAKHGFVDRCRAIGASLCRDTT